MAYIWDEAAYDEGYRYPIDRGAMSPRLIGYGLEMFNVAPQLWQQRIQDLGLRGYTQPADHQLIVGCGFGYEIQLILNAGGSNVWGTDISAYILAKVAEDLARAEGERLYIPSTAAGQRILGIDVTASDAPTQFFNAGAGFRNPAARRGRFSTVISTDVVSSFLDDLELAPFLAGCANCTISGGKTIHLVTTSNVVVPPYLRSMSLEEWAAKEPAHLWIDAVTFEAAGAV